MSGTLGGRQKLPARLDSRGVKVPSKFWRHCLTSRFDGNSRRFLKQQLEFLLENKSLCSCSQYDCEFEYANES